MNAVALVVGYAVIGLAAVGAAWAALVVAGASYYWWVVLGRTPPDYPPGIPGSGGPKA